ncbi:MAG: segregation/condensation protein A [Alphaproteobacteria bacterium]|nr:segregation/condensation protein A [Alphaproteobacteria bacterium]
MLAAASTPTWTVRTEVFDGPLDLLLYLVKRDGIDLRRVSIARVADSYLHFLDMMHELNISVAADYLVMAATLCHLKSLELLPRPPVLLEDEEGVDPREALARQLEIYERYKEAAEALEARPWLGRDVFCREPMDVGEVERPLVPGVDAFGLLEAYYGVLTRPVPVTPSHTIKRPEVDLAVCSRRVLTALGGVGGRSDLMAVLRTFASKAERVVSFLAILEMIRLGWVRFHQAEHLAPVELTSQVPVDQDLSAIRGEVFEAEAG